MNIVELYELYKQFPSVQIDTRNLKPNDIFFALKGKNFNGNHFAKKALENGAAYVVIDEKEYEIKDKTILVDDVLTTLQRLANFHRNEFRIPFIAITGSNGKTTCKELIHEVLSSSFKTYTTEGNLNNHIGVPLTLLKIKKDADIAVIEMGANHIGEIDSYCRIALPTHGVITNCGKAHLEGFGSIEGVKKGKGELYEHLRNKKGTAFVMWDYDYLREMSKGIKEIISYGTSDADFVGSVIPNDLYLHVKIANSKILEEIKTKLVGDYNFPNVLAAVAVGKYFKVTDEKIKSAIENYRPSNNRSQLIEKGSNKIILDAYNANPSSMMVAIRNFAKIQSDNKILMLGAMAELGEESLDEHRTLINFIKKYNWKEVVLVGGDFLKIDHPFSQFENADQVKEWLRKKDFKNSFFLIKGSRSIGMEKVIE
jgi:UDP-N-acetylmuramoyl-tripeptide--D-alanyl-D-alanine ligase